MKEKNKYEKLKKRVMRAERRITALETEIQGQSKEITIKCHNAKTSAELQSDLRNALYQLV